MARQRRYLKGKTVEEQLTEADTTLAHFSSKLSTKVIGAMPPMFYSNYVADPTLTDGVLLECIFPLGCTVLSGVMFVEEYLQESGLVRFTAELHRLPDFMAAQEFETRKQFFRIDVSQIINLGDRLRYRINNPAAAKRIWSGFLCECPLSNLIEQEYAIEEFERLVELDAEEGGGET